MGKPTVPVSVVLPTWNRLEALKSTLNELYSCDPLPAEIIVHVDAGDSDTEPWLRVHASNVRVLTSDQQLGPGGSRNRLLEAARQPYVASFDDDSYPIDADYFARLIAAFERHPSAGVLATTVIRRGEMKPAPTDRAEPVSDFIGCGCAYRAVAWRQVDGYLPRAVPYGIEEPDVALQMLDRGWAIIHDYRLRVFHDTDLPHRADLRKTAGTIVNMALLPFVRYPVRYVGWGCIQYLNRIHWSLRKGQVKGALCGIRRTLPVLWAYRTWRNPVHPSAVKKYRELRK